MQSRCHSEAKPRISSSRQQPQRPQSRRRRSRRSHPRPRPSPKARSSHHRNRKPWRRHWRLVTTPRFPSSWMSNSRSSTP
ncbi:unnamed protein product, partial [Symbiodinium necroappetens]